MIRFNKSLAVVVVSLVAFLSAGCNDPENFVDAKFSSPSSVVVAGTDQKRLFVANAGSGTLQVLQLQDELGEMTFEESQLIYFPLEIPLGTKKGYPSELVASSDGRYVLALDSAAAAIHIIDAQELEPINKDEEGAATFAFNEILSTSSSTGYLPASLITGRLDCGANCLGEFYLTLQKASAVVGLRLSKSDKGELTLIEFTRVVIDDSSPGELAISLDNQSLFVADVHQPAIYHLELNDGEPALAATIPTGVVAGSLAVSGAGDYLLVGRPQFLDLVLFSLVDASGDISLVDLNAEAGPELTCLDPCTPAANSEDSNCQGAHPGASAICIEEQGLGLSGDGYGGIYLGAMPSKILALGGSGGHPSLVVPCQEDFSVEDSSVDRVYSEYALVATEDGAIHMVGLELRDSTEETVFTPELASFGWCRTSRLEVRGEASVVVKNETVQKDLGLLTAALGPCPAAPERAQFECLTSISSGREITAIGEQEDFGVVSLAGRTTWAEVKFDWEGALSLDLVHDDGGQVTITGNFTDVDLNLGNFEDIIKPGDILEITTELLKDDVDCKAALGENINSLCGVERRIVGVPTKEDPVLVLDSPLPLSCFRGGGRVGYRIRMGDSFAITTSSGERYRLKPGEHFGPGGVTGLNESILFATQPAPGGVDSAVPACDRYSAAGLLESNTDSYFRRSVGNALTDSVNNTFGFTVEDSHLDVSGYGHNDSNSFFIRTGLRLVRDSDQSLVEKGTAGRLPSQMMVSSFRGEGKDPVVFVSYAGTNAVLAFVPYYPTLGSVERFQEPVYFLLE